MKGSEGRDVSGKVDPFCEERVEEMASLSSVIHRNQLRNTECARKEVPFKENFR